MATPSSHDLDGTTTPPMKRHMADTVTMMIVLRSPYQASPTLGYLNIKTGGIHDARKTESTFTCGRIVVKSLSDGTPSRLMRREILFPRPTPKLARD